MLEEGKSNYLCSVYYEPEEGKGGVAFCDISTGEFCVASYETDAVNHILNELGRFEPREVIMNKAAADTKRIPEFAAKRLHSMLEMGGKDYEFRDCSLRIRKQFDVQKLTEINMEAENSLPFSSTPVVRCASSQTIKSKMYSPAAFSSSRACLSMMSARARMPFQNSRTSSICSWIS